MLVLLRPVRVLGKNVGSANEERAVMGMASINWRNWGEPAFKESKESGKPVLLSISATWCHWCHVMDQRSYSDPRIIEIMNRDYIPVRVDTDREPDINTRYNMGGWPSTVFLTGDHDVLTGATYMPPDQMLIVLDRVSTAYIEQNHELMEKARQARLETEESFRQAAGGASKAADVDRILETLRSSYDPLNAGFGTSQKFPHPVALQLLLFSFETTGNVDDLKMATDTLDAMIEGEVFDKVEGGIFRYATKRDWTEPHYEKLLSDNAKMAYALLDAYRLTGKDSYLETARQVFEYLETTLMHSKTGLFHGSQDADKGYYEAGVEERKKLAAPSIDPALYTDSNAMLACSYVKLYGVGKDPMARDKALRIVASLNCKVKSTHGSVAHYIADGKAHEFGVLGDAVNLVFANLACCEATGDETYIRTVKEMLEAVFAEFGSEQGAFFDIGENRAKKRGLSRYSTPIEENSMLAMAFIKLADMTEDEAYRLSSKRVLDALSAQYDSYGIMAAIYALALGILSSPPMLVTINAEPGTEEADALIGASLGSCGMNCTVRTVENEGEEAAASLCLGKSCRIRVTDPDDLSQALQEIQAIGSRQ